MAAGSRRDGTGGLSRPLFAAEHAVEIAVGAMTRGRAHVRALIDKGDYGFATVVDVEVERLVRAHLREATPEIPFLGEEEGGQGLMSEAVWLLDPIDGTANYADGSPLCAISLALLRRGRPVLGLVAAPLLGERFVAVEGGGAFRNGVRIHVAQREVGDPLVALSDFAFGRKHRDTNQLRFAVIEELVRRSMRLRIHGSVALDLAWLAAGRLSATVALSNLAWDVSAGVLLVQEAGGLVFDADGSQHAPQSSSTLAAVPALRETLVSVMAAAKLCGEPRTDMRHPPDAARLMAGNDPSPSTEGAAMYRRIAVGYDGSAQARDALALASTLRADDGVVVAACVYPITGPGRGQQLESVLADAARETLAGAREQTAAEWLELRPVPGHSPAHGLHMLSEQAETDLVVVGSAHRGKVGQLLAGSTGERLLNGSPCPVALAPKGFPAGAGRARVIGVAYDGSRDAASALREAATLAAELGAALKLITVVPPLDVFTTGSLYAPHHTDEEIATYRRAEFGQMLEDAAEPLADGLQAATVLAEGRAADQIVAEARKDIDLLVMGSRSYGPLRRVMMGSTAIEVMRLAPCPVIVVPRGVETPSVDAPAAATTA